MPVQLHPRMLSNNRGFTMIATLTVVVIIGIMMSMSVQSWKTIKQRDLEEELIFRGDQVAEIVYQRLACKGAKMEPGAVEQFFWPAQSANGTILDDLAIGKDERCTDGSNRKFRLRRTAIIDPLTNEPWQLLPAGTNMFSGVASKGKGTPFKKDFRDLYDNGRSPDVSLAPNKPPESKDGPYSADLLNRDKQDAEQKQQETKKQYSDWQFTWELKQPAPASTLSPKVP